MPITYPLDFPALGVAEITLRARSVVGVATSPFTFTRQVQSFDGQRWEADLSFPVYDRLGAGAVEAFLLQLNGRQGTFLLGDPLRTAPLGVGTGTSPRVKGAGQTGNSLLTQGWTINVTGILKAGDLIQLGTGATARLHKVLQDVNSNASGETTLTLWPALRAAPADNATLTLANCRGVFALADNVATWSVDKNNFYASSLTAIEVV